jgi:hypothetical protein
MTTNIKIDSSALLRWARYLDEVPRSSKAAVARAMNDYGRGVAESKAQVIAGQTGLDVHEVRALIEVEEATPERLIWKMDASAIVPPPQDWERPWDARSNKNFEQQTLVKIVTSGDDHTCEVCQEAADKSPYTMDEINALAGKWQHWQPAAGIVGERTNLIHPNCRCILQPWRQTRRLSVSFGGKGAPAELLNARQLGRRVADELKVTIRALKR